MTAASAPDYDRPDDSEGTLLRHPWRRIATAAGLTAVLLVPLPPASASPEADTEAEEESTPEEQPTEDEATEETGDDAVAEDEEEPDQEPRQEPEDEEGSEEDSGPEDPDSEEPDSDEQTEESPEEDAVVDFSIVASNDFHGRLEESASVIACTVKQQREENPNTIFASAGDNIGATTFTSFIQQDEPTIDALNAMDLDVAAFGNHEFDQGAADMDDRVIPMSDFPWIGANIRDADTGEHLYDPYYIQEVEGVRVGFIGLITEDMPRLVSPDGIEGIEWTSMSEEANFYAEHLTENDLADVVTVLVHEGLPGTSLESAAGRPFSDVVNNAHPEIDAIMSGHTHLPYVHDVGDMLLTQAGEYGNYVNVLDFSFDPATGELVESEAELVDLFPGGEPLCEGHAEVDQIVSDAVATADELGTEIVAETSGEIPFARAVNSDGSENRSAASTVGQLVADAQLWAIRQNQPEVDFAVTNAGGLRADLPLGELTFRDLGDVQPFANTLVNVELTGEQVHQLFEEQWRPDGSFSKHAQSAGVRYTYDPEAPEGERILQVTIDGEIVEPEGTYYVGMNSYMAAGGGVEVPLESANAMDTGMNDLEAFVEYAREQEVLEPSLERRAVGTTWVSENPDDAVYSPGDELALNLSGLAYSSEDIPAGTSVNVSLAGYDLGDFDVETGFMDSTDERGQASIRAEIPSALEYSGTVSPGLGAMTATGTTEEEIEVPLVIQKESTGTELTIPVTVAGSAGAESEDGDAANGESPTDGSSPGAPSAEEQQDIAAENDSAEHGSADEESAERSSGESTPAAPSSSESGEAAAAQQTGGGLAMTGAQALWIAAAALVLLAMGAFLILRARVTRK